MKNELDHLDTQLSALIALSQQQAQHIHQLSADKAQLYALMTQSQNHAVHLANKNTQLMQQNAQLEAILEDLTAPKQTGIVQPIEQKETEAAHG